MFKHKYLLGSIFTLLFAAFLTMGFVEKQSDTESMASVETVQFEITNACGCPPGWYLEGEHNVGKDWDKNDDGLICYKSLYPAKGHGNDKDIWKGLVHKDNLPCK